MADRGKLIRGLQNRINESRNHGGIAVTVALSTLSGALVLLKEQEPVKPITAREGRNKYWSYYICPICNDDLNYGQKYCSECGRAVKWDAAD